MHCFIYPVTVPVLHSRIYVSYSAFLAFRKNLYTCNIQLYICHTGLYSISKIKNDDILWVSFSCNFSTNYLPLYGVTIRQKTISSWMDTNEGQLICCKIWEIFNSLAYFFRNILSCTSTKFSELPGHLVWM